MVSFRQVMLVGVVFGAVACSKKTPEPAQSQQATTNNNKKTATPVSQAAAQAAKDVGNERSSLNEGKLDPNDPKHGTRRLVGLDVPVYVDGAQAAVLRAGEMPPIPAVDFEGGGRRFRVADYLKGIGVPVESVKSIHFHANADRIGSVEGSELRNEKDKNRFAFSFTAGESGAPLAKWDTDHLKNEFNVHEIRRITIYVKKPSPAIHPQKQCHTGADGDCSEAIPYATGEVAKGTRIYLDGKMVGFVKRKQVTDAMMIGAPAEDQSNTHFSLAKLVAGFGVDPTGVKSVELMAGDDVIARATGEQFLANAPTTYFTLPKHNHGKVRVNVPAELQAKSSGIASSNRDALVSSVLFYKNTSPSSDRSLVAISEDTDLSVQLAAIDDARGRLGRGEQ
jgi:hypothetical protein